MPKALPTKQSEINWKVSEYEHNLIKKIADRTIMLMEEFNGDHPPEKMEVMMDIIACHANGCPLKLHELLAADDFNFLHDVNGTHNYINRETAQLERCFLPRFALTEYDTEYHGDSDD